MIDPKRLDALLEELYAIEPDLRARDTDLRRLAAELLASKPDAPIDERFIERLRGELMVRASVIQPQHSFMRFLTSKNRYLVPGLALLVLAVAAGAALQSFMPGRQASPMRTASGPAIERVEANAFGTLATSPQGSEAAFNADAASRSSAPSGEAGVPAPQPSVAVPPLAGGGSDAGGDAKLIAPDWIPTIYRYTYAGEAIENLASQIDVYRRVKGTPPVGPIAALSEVNLGLIDLSKAKDSFVQSFTIAEQRDNGYVFNVDPQEGMINIFQNAKWFSVLSRCLDQNCYEQNRLKESDLLSDEESIRIADAFLAEYGISKADYGAAIVNDQWRVMYNAMDASARSSYWFPEGISVVYPILVDSKVAYDEGGSPYGLNVNVDVRAKRAQSVWNLFTRTYQVSSYAAETDAKRLISIAENTDNYDDAGSMPPNTKTVTVELGTPTIAYVRSWQQTGSTGAELLVPALIFPIKNQPADLWRTNVIVPLAKDLLDATGNQPRPMPVDAPIMLDAPAIKETK